MGAQQPSNACDLHQKMKVSRRTLSLLSTEGMRHVYKKQSSVFYGKAFIYLTTIYRA